ncbi:dihydrolipoyl dehydrogenase [Micrococcales bacterium 31B]|nr:dihydrolipoyl dehydrogenase [Micrococcales bacterium 31B]
MADTTANPVYDVVILGGGSGGYATALRSAQLGLNVALIEKAELGGTCLHRGCVPTKALLHAAEVADVAREGAAIGVNTQLNGVDMVGVNKYKDGIIGRLYKGLQGLVKSSNVTFIQGEGKLVGKDTIAVTTAEGVQNVSGKNLVLASGSFSKTLPGLELGGRIIASEHALKMDFVPKSAIILGGGVIGVEFASVWKSFGADVTIVEGLPSLAPNEDAALSKALERAFRKRKINFKTGVFFQSATQDDNGVHVTLADGTQLDAEVLLVAVGRGPQTAGLGYEEQGITMDRGFVLTNENLQTNVPGIYAVGDIVPGLQLAHRGFQQGIFVAEVIAGQSPLPIVESGIPRVTYCEPELASVGLTEKQAADKYGADQVQTYEYNLGGNGKSQILGTQGFIKLVREKDGPIVGVHMIGARVGEQIGEAQLIVNWEAHPEDVAHLIHAHPTQNEALGEAHLAIAGKPLHAHA